MTLAIVFLSLLIAGLAGALGAVWHRARTGRRQLSSELHARSLALDQRADLLAGQIEGLELAHRLSRLSEQIVLAHRRDLLSRGAANRLGALVLAWRAEATDLRRAPR